MSYELSVVRDPEPVNPREEYEQVSILYCEHGRYQLGDVGAKEPEAKDVLASLPLYLYDHSGITISTTPFSCQWDSGQVGRAYITHESAKAYGITEEEAENVIRGEVEEYDCYLRGDIWGYEIVDTETEDGDVVASCYGFTDEEECRMEGEQEAQAFEE